ncbi:hypothetical protein ACJX0J_008396, partial [Zea mays]
MNRLTAKVDSNMKTEQSMMILAYDDSIITTITCTFGKHTVPLSTKFYICNYRTAAEFRILYHSENSV